MTTTTALDWRQVAEALGGETAVRILELFAERGELSAKDVHAELNGTGGSLGNVSYHVRRLRDRGLLEQTRQEPRRGAIQTYYRLKRGDQ